MTFDGTKVDPEELRTFGTGAHDRAGRAGSVADAVAGVHLGTDMLGLFSVMFLGSAREDQQTIASTLRTTATTLAEDGDVAKTNADDVEHTNTTQTNRFKEEAP